MEWGNLTTAAVAVSLATLFVRWRLPSVPPAIASGGAAGALAVAALSFFHPPLGLAISIVLNVALIIGVMDYGLLGRKKTKSVTKTDSHLELRVHGDGRAPTGIVTTNIWRWFTLDLGVLSINNETGERSDMHLATVLFVTFDQMTTTRNLSVSSPDMVLPRYEVKDFCERSAVISFETKLSPGILFVRTHH